MGSDNHYAEFILNFPSGGSGQGTLGPCIAVDSAAQDYFYLEVDLINDQVELFRVNTGTDTSIAGPTAFTMDEDEDYLVHLRRDSTETNQIEAFISGNSVADGFHTTKLAAADTAHTGTTHRLVGLRGDALAGQSGDAPRVRLFWAGPITDDLGSVILPTTASLDFEDANLINCARALTFDNTGTYSLTNLTLSNNLVGAQNDSDGSVTGNRTGTSDPASVENIGDATSTFPAAETVSVTIVDQSGVGIQNVQVSIYLSSDDTEVMNSLTNVSGVASTTFSGTTPAAIYVRWRKSSTGSTRYIPSSATGTIETGTGYTSQFIMQVDDIVQA
mgnify:CR=1 FL=1